MPPGHQAISNKGVALTPELQPLRSLREAARTPVIEENGNTKIRGCREPYQEGTLLGRAEYHQNQFWQKLMEQNLEPFAPSTICGSSLQGGSTTQESREFLKVLGSVVAKEQTPEVSFFRKPCLWLSSLGNGCSLRLVRWIVRHPWYNGSRIIRSLE